MTLNQLESLSEDEIQMVLYIVNIISPLTIPKMVLHPKHLVWFKHDSFVKKLIDAFPQVLPEGHAVYASLLKKLGINAEIKYGHPPSSETSSETLPPPLEASTPVADVPISGSSETNPTSSI